MSDERTRTGLIGYEFEVERETRIIVAPRDIAAYDWVNHVVDTYDRSGRVRIRVKGGKPRLSCKVPLFGLDNATSKTCLRLEFKPTCPEQEADLLKMRDLILAEAGAQVNEKWGARVQMDNGQVAWLNRDTAGNWWFEIDEGVDFTPSAEFTVLGYAKSLIDAK